VPEWLAPYAKPREGWLSWFLVFVMLLSVGWSVQSAGWLDHMDYLIPVALYASLLGTILALSQWRVLVTLPISAVTGAAIVIWTVGGEYFPVSSQLDRLIQLRADALDWAKVISQLGYPNELSPYSIGLAMIMWVTAFIATYTLFRHHRAIDAILLVGAALIVNLSATILDLFGYLVLFVLAALLLWLRVSLLDREDGWRRRRVNENVEVPASIMRTGVVFIAATIALSWILTSVAVAAPLTDAWRSLDSAWGGVRDDLSQWFGALDNDKSRLPGTSFGNRITVKGSWTSKDTPVLTLAADHPFYLETVTFDIYTGHGWASSKGTERSVAPNTAVMPAGNPEQPATKVGFEVEAVTIQLQAPSGRNLFTPGYPLTVSAPAVVSQPGGDPFLGALVSQNAIHDGQGYTVKAVIPSGVTEAQLRGAGKAYPASVTARYLGTDGITSQTRLVAQQIVTNAGAKTPYDMAVALVRYLKGPAYEYATNVGTPPANRDLVDYFLFQGKRGYCEFFASAMALMARSLGLPARVAEGYSPGKLIGKDLYEYRESNAHAWAEIYFPGYGWQIFESTKSIDAKFVRPTGGSQQLNPVVKGTEDRVAAPFQEGENQLGKGFTLQSVAPIGGGTIGTTAPQSVPTSDARGGGLLVLLVVIVVASAAIWWRLLRAGRRIRFLAPGDRQWALLLLAADRAGVSQRPSETDYEYAGWLEEQLPQRSPEIRTIADARVWGTYSGRGMTAEAVARMQAAWRRLRMPFVWLAVRRRARSVLPRRPR
jgi:Transglutaminase-like superfamily/TgpA N-terminal domain